MRRSLKKCKSGWKRELGTSKKEQGIVTPKAPRKNKRGKKIRILMPNAMKKRLDAFKEWLKEVTKR